MDKSKKVCGVCETDPSKYKCPTCTLPYCSLVCYKKHKETPCEKPAPIPEPETIPVPPVKQVPDYLVEEPVALLNDEQLDMISQSSAIQEMLKNDGLRRLVRMIDSSENPEYLLDKARKDDRHFMEFSDEILAVIAREPGQSGTDQVLEAMGMGEKP
ncbi:zinc finger HIT domain-containing protein 3 [Dissophora ornata]|nr:zinc finger HIT domain-containing protein 3 [Dissophora ornata]